MAKMIEQFRERHRALQHLELDEHKLETGSLLLRDLRAAGAYLVDLDERDEVAQIARHVGGMLTSLTGGEVAVRLLPLDPTALRAHSEAVAAARSKGLPEPVAPPAQPGPADIPLDGVAPIQVLPPASRVAPRHSPLFVGRDENLWRLARLFRSGEDGQDCRRAVITGIGGVGKSQLACEFAYRYGAYFGGGVFWLRASDDDQLQHEIAACGGAGHMRLWEGHSTPRLEDQVALVQAAWQDDTPRLIIFDGCEDEELLGRWLPAGPGCRVLVTSRRAVWSPVLGLTELPLGPLPRAASVALLRAFRPDLAAHDPTLDAIAAHLGDLPLAVHLAGSYLARYRQSLPLATYLAQLQAITLGAPGPAEEHRGVAQGMRELEQTFALSYGGLRPDVATDRLALRLLQRAAHFAPGVPIPRPLLLSAAQIDPDDIDRSLDADDAIFRLYELGLLSGDELSGTLLLHRLLAVFVLRVATDETALTDVRSVLTAAGDRAHERQEREGIEQIYPHIRWLVDHSASAGDAARLMTELVRLLSFFGEYREVQRYAEHALALRAGLLGADHADTAQSMFQLAWALVRLGDYSPARDLYQRALGAFRAADPPDLASVAKTLREIANLANLQGDPQRAQDLLREALAINEQAKGEDDPETASILNNLAVSLHLAGSYAEARAYYERAYAIYARLYPDGHQELAVIQQNLGELDQLAGELSQARARFGVALAILERTLGARHPDTAYTLHHLGRCLHEQGQADLGRAALQRALDIRLARLGPDHPDTVATAAALGEVMPSAPH